MPASRPPSTIERFLDAVNRHDEAAFLAFFPPDGVVDDWGRRFVGPEEIRGWSDREFIGVNITLQLTDCLVSDDGDEVVVSAEVGGDGFNGPSDFAFKLDGDRIREVRITA